MQSTLLGHVAQGFEPVADYLQSELENQPGYAFQLAVRVGAEQVLDLHSTALADDAVMVPFSVSKSSIGFVLAHLLDRGLVDLDAPVASFWPEFAAHDKGAVTVRQLFSHQAGLPQIVPPLGILTLADPVPAAEALAAAAPLWQPGIQHGYHAVTIGVLADAVVRRLTGESFADYFETHLRAPRGIEFHLSPDAATLDRVAELQPPLTVPPATEPPSSQAEGQLGSFVFAGSIPAATISRTPGDGGLPVGMPAASAIVSARGIADLYAESVVGVQGPPLVSAEAIEAVSRAQVRGLDAVVGVQRSYGVVFQKPGEGIEFGGFRAFGHDGAGGALGFHDPESVISFGYTVQHMVPPGGADPRARHVARLLRSLVVS